MRLFSKLRHINTINFFGFELKTSTLLLKTFLPINIINSYNHELCKNLVIFITFLIVVILLRDLYFGKSLGKTETYRLHI